jgi:3',5'-cyclic AMP phosphodiesterase CpdA
MMISRRNFIKLAGYGSIIVMSGLNGRRGWAEEDALIFVQMSDLHWGFKGPAVNPDPDATTKKAIAAVNSLDIRPDFIVLTGDLTHTTDDDKERRKRMGEIRDLTAGLEVKTLKFMPGEHDAGLDRGEAFQEFFGQTHYTFDHKGVHFIVLDNVSDPTSSIGEDQLQWLAADLKKQARDARIIVFTHRPLYDLLPEWDWDTRDGAKAMELLAPFANVNVFYGHIHQEIHHTTGNIAHHSAKGLMYPLPAPRSLPKKIPLPWDPATPYKGLGWRSVDVKAGKTAYRVNEYSLTGEKL